ncbi:MAG: methylmalonyl-CoA mutase family protein [Bradymonadia bacterium]
MADLDLTTPEPPLTFEDWRARVERDLKGADFEKRLVTPTLEGIDVQPLYHREGPALATGARRDGRAPGWIIASRIDAPDPQVAAEAITTDLAFGVEQLRFVTDVSVRLGGMPEGDGVVLDSAGALLTALSEVDLKRVHLAFEVGARGPVMAQMLDLVARDRGVSLSALNGEIGADPLGALAADGALPVSIEAAFDDLRALARWAHERAPGLRAARVSVAPHQECGAHWGQAVSWALATGLTYLRALTEGEGALTVAEAASQMCFEVAVGRDTFMAIAGIRALRHTWGRVLEACGAPEASVHTRIHSRTARHGLSRRDARVNMLRTTAAAFASVLGGADSVSVTPFDRPLGVPTADARRHALHIQTLLREEAHLGKVADPAGGSAYIEALTEALCEKAWAGLQQIERERGMVRRVISGRVAAAVAETAVERRRRIARAKDPLVGVSAFPWLDEPVAANRPARRPDVGEESLTGEAPEPEAVVAPAMAPFSEAHEFEYLRDMSDAVLANTGARPSVFLANIGPLAHYKPRADFSAQLLAAGGIAALDQGGYDTAEAAAEAFTASGAAAAVLCGRDGDYVEVAEGFAQALKAAGAQTVMLAGRPGEHEAAWRTAGVDTFIYRGVNILAVLHGLMEEVGK